MAKHLDIVASYFYLVFTDSQPVFINVTLDCVFVQALDCGSDPKMEDRFDENSSFPTISTSDVTIELASLLLTM